MYGASYIDGSIALGAGATITAYNQFMAAPNVTQFNIPGLVDSTGTRTGTILKFDSAGNVLPTEGTYKTVLAIGTAIAAINAPYAMSWATNNDTCMTAVLMSKPFPSGTPSTLVILPAWQPKDMSSCWSVAHCCHVWLQYEH